MVWYVLSREDNEESFWNDHWPVKGRAVSSMTVLEKVTLNRRKSVSGTPGARRVNVVKKRTLVMWSWQ